MVGLAKTVSARRRSRSPSVRRVRRRHVVLRHPELEWKLRHPLDRIRRDPGNRRYGRLDAHLASPSRPLHARAFRGASPSRASGPGQGRSSTTALAARRLEVRVCDIRVGRLHLHARAVAGCELRYGVEDLLVLGSRADHQKRTARRRRRRRCARSRAGRGRSPTGAASAPRLDEERALAGEHEEVLLRGLGRGRFDCPGGSDVDPNAVLAEPVVPLLERALDASRPPPTSATGRRARRRRTSLARGPQA